MLRCFLPALWGKNDEPALIASISEIVSRYNGNELFFLPWPVDNNKTGLLTRNHIRYQAFPWALPIAEIPLLCKFCTQRFEFTLANRPVYVKGSVAQFV